MQKILYLLILISSVSFAMNNSLQITFLKHPQSISQLVSQYENLTTTKNPNKLSSTPSAFCFPVNINEYLLEKSLRKPIFGCIFSDQVTMNAALLRAGMFVHTKMGMPNDKALFNSKLMTTVGGHDFDGKELFNYKQHITAPENTLPKYTLMKRIEQEFDNKIITPIISQYKDNFIFFAIINTKKFRENLSHELLHAQYYNTPEIQIALLKVWKKSSSADQKIILNAFQKGGYDIEQQELLLREFYSYFLQYNAKNYLSSIKVLANLAPLADKYKQEIEAEFALANIKILSVVS